MKIGNQLLDSVLGPCPCDHCGQRELCDDFDMACGDFLIYVRTGKNLMEDRYATRDLHSLIFSEEYA